MKDLSVINKKFEDLRQEYKEALIENIQEFLKKYPYIKYIAWAQGTPNWNDGDACYFRANEPILVLDKKETNKLVSDKKIRKDIEVYYSKNICDFYEGFERFFVKKNNNWQIVEYDKIFGNQVAEDFHVLKVSMEDSTNFEEIFGNNVSVKIFIDKIKINNHFD